MSRVYDWPGAPLLQPGEYAYWADRWWGCTPDDQLADFSEHEVTEHEDGTITVWPSIVVRGGTGPAWHGYVIRGIWRRC